MDYHLQLFEICAH